MIHVHKNKNYTAISNVALNDKRLSWKAKGLLAFLLSRPDDWNFSVSNISSYAKDGRDSITKGLEELEKNGYLTRTQALGDDGKFSGFDYDVYESPITEKPITEKPITENPSTVKKAKEKEIKENAPLIEQEKVTQKEIDLSSQKENYIKENEKRVSSKPKDLDWYNVEEANFERVEDAEIIPFQDQKDSITTTTPQPPSNSMVEVESINSQAEFKAAQQKEIEDKDKADITDYNAFVRYWNEKTKGVFGKLRGIDGKRRDMLRARIREYGRKAFDEAVENALQSDFLKGQSSKGWTMDFEWFVRPSNFQKVLENKYQNKDTNGISDEEYRQRAVREAANAVMYGGRVGGITYGNAYSTLLAERERLRGENPSQDDGGFI